MRLDDIEQLLKSLGLRRMAELLPDELSRAIDELEDFQRDKPKIAYEVTSDVVAQVVSDWTGVPLGKLRASLDELPKDAEIMRAGLEAGDVDVHGVHALAALSLVDATDVTADHVVEVEDDHLVAGRPQSGFGPDGERTAVAVARRVGDDDQREHLSRSLERTVLAVLWPASTAATAAGWTSI